MSSGSACWILWLTPMDWLALSIGRSGSQPLEYSILNADRKSSLTSVFEDWIKETEANQRVLEEREKEFIEIFNIKDYDDVSVVNKISKSLMRINIADWERDNSKDVLAFVDNLCKTIKERKFISEVMDSNFNNLDINDNEEISVMGNLLKNNIEEIFEEFGDSISNEEKIKILTNLIKKMM